MGTEYPPTRNQIYGQIRKRLIDALGGHFKEIIIGGAAMNPEVEEFFHKIRFPEEIEAKLNNMPFILESLVIERNKKLVALVYADYEALDSSLGLNQEEHLQTIMNENLKNLNNIIASYEKVNQIQLYPTEFEKTPKRSIKRYLYSSISEN